MVGLLRHEFSHGSLILGDCVDFLSSYSGERFQSIIADPPYFRVLPSDWDNSWNDSDAYLSWSLSWVRLCMSHLADDGLLFIFGQIGKREHVFLHLCSALCREFQFHDLLVWDRVVGYSGRSDSFTPQYENILVLRKSSSVRPYFDKDSYRLGYSEATIQKYLKDGRYKDIARREAHLRRGKHLTNILSFPSLKGGSVERVGHPSQKPIKLIEVLVGCSSRAGDLVYDPFLGSGTTAVVCESLGRSWIGSEVSRDYFDLIKSRLSE